MFYSELNTIRFVVLVTWKIGYVNALLSHLKKVYFHALITEAFLILNSDKDIRVNYCNGSLTILLHNQHDGQLIQFHVYYCWYQLLEIFFIEMSIRDRYYCFLYIITECIRSFKITVRPILIDCVGSTGVISCCWALKCKYVCWDVHVNTSNYNYV